MPRKKTAKSNALVQEMDAMATSLLKELQSDTILLETKLNTFTAVAKWMAVRNRIEDTDDGLGLDAYKSQIQSSDRVGEDDNPRSRRARAGAAARYGLATAGGKGGAALAAIKESLPRISAADGDDTDHAGDGGGGADAAVSQPADRGGSDLSGAGQPGAAVSDRGGGI